jgi:hypothetical protein
MRFLRVLGMPNVQRTAVVKWHDGLVLNAVLTNR